MILIRYISLKSITLLTFFLNIKACLLFYKATHSSVLSSVSPDLSVWDLSGITLICNIHKQIST